MKEGKIKDTGNIRAKRTIEKMVANGGKTTSMAQAMREAGYSESYARNPQKIKNTQAWSSSTSTLLSNELIDAAHQSLLTAERIQHLEVPPSLTDSEIGSIFNTGGRSLLSIKRGKRVSVIFTEPDHTARARGVDLAYKIKGTYTFSSSQSQWEQFNREFEHYTTEELDELIEQYKGFFKKQNPLPSV